MKSYDERTKDILLKAAAVKKRRKIITGTVSLCCCMVLLCGILLLPNSPAAPTITETVAYNTQPESHGDSTPVNSYTPLINSLSAIFRSNSEGGKFFDDTLEGAPPTAEPDTGASNGPGYEEITDNQVEGVTEADLIKRSDKHIFYLHGGTLSVYSIDGLNSHELGAYTIGSELSGEYTVQSFASEMYLSVNCRTITVLTQVYNAQYELFLYILSLDVTDPENITVSGSCFLNSHHSTSRLIDDKLYVISSLYVRPNADLTDISAYVPGYGTPECMTYLPMNRICIPASPSASSYTVITQLDNSTLKVTDSLALLSYTGTMYMSQENLYICRPYHEENTVENGICLNAFTEITRISYGNEGLKNMGSFKVEGSVANQYQMDEHDGILRVVTSVSERSGYIKSTNSGNTYYVVQNESINANLFCIDLTDHSIRAEVKRFAPDGENVKSARFDGDAAYVCTAIQLRDPVFFFDLSDLDNIRWKDTGTIDGFSLSLIDFAEGYLMGIGHGDLWTTLKIEMYREGETTVESHCVYEYSNCYFSDDYKSYYIDRTNQFVGLALENRDSYHCSYLLLHFDGTKFVELATVPLENVGQIPTSNIRAVYIDGYLYVLSRQLQVLAIP